MKYSIFWVITISCFVIGIRELNYLIFLCGIIFNLYVIITNYYSEFFLNLFLSGSYSQELMYKIQKGHIIYLSGGSSIYYPCIKFIYEINNKKYKGNFSYDVRFFSPDINDAESFATSLNRIKFYYSPKNHKICFPIKPLNKAMVKEKYYLICLFLIQILGLIFIRTNLDKMTLT
ncbi:hypothetical protein MOMA_02215 [Moraxella macacae 0408225]|uniref:Uncharacterized protein n=1 Tax=Moraxella macacae 0408225 TaxID=1230338 RepID=L2F7Z7_9GAMM|nr:hypothetical protein MOMA_02215 [Moraxella macacae 0408225]